MKKIEMTHTEACELVESSLERVARTLMRLRLKLDFNRIGKDSIPGIGGCAEWRIKAATDEANLLCNINYYGAYLKGAKDMYLALERMFYLDFHKKKDDWLISKAQLKLFMESTRNLEWLLTEIPQGVELYTQLERDRKGKVVGAKAKFIKKVVKYEEVKD